MDSSGTVYKLDRVGHESVLYSFTAGADGAYPTGGLTRDSAGNLYGTTYMNETFGEPQGVVYKIDDAGRMTVLYGFTGGADGANPSGVTRDSAGNLYGTTSGGGNAWGVIYKLSTSNQETVLYTFPETDGYHPASGLARDASGNFYGTTFYGGSKNLGAVYKLDAAGHETVLHSFTGGVDGAYPLSVVCLDSAGNVYGTSAGGGASGAGFVYKLDSSGQETVLYSFTGGADGGGPGPGALVRDTAGNLYGTAEGGGAAGGGVVYKLDATGHETVLYSFTGSSDGGAPESGVIRDSAGNFYGTTLWGGTANQGVVYKLDLALHQSVLYSFTGHADAGCPTGVVRDLAGNLYGVAPGCNQQPGIVYKNKTEIVKKVLRSKDQSPTAKDEPPTGKQ